MLLKEVQCSGEANDNLLFGACSKHYFKIPSNYEYPFPQISKMGKKTVNKHINKVGIARNTLICCTF